MRRKIFVLSVLAASSLSGASLAQSTTSGTKHNNNTYGSPLDTIMSTHLWTDVAPAKGFVQESRPDATTLDYTPLVGKDPERPKPRDKANIAALQAEMESDLTTNSRKGSIAPRTAKTAPKARHAKAKIAN